MSHETIIAIDPGASGAIAVRDYASEPYVIPMPETEADTLDAIRDICAQAHAEGFASKAYVEHVGGFTGRPQPGSAMFKFGFGAGFVKGCLMTLGVPVEYVRPQDWQKGLLIGKSDTKPEHKRKLRAKAQELFPALKPTLTTCDALLILRWATTGRAQV